ncbi:MAG: sodium:calcium antiporter [Pseudomonadota bacterium]
MQFLVLLLGLTGLWAGTELTIKGAVAVAKKLGLSEFIVGAAILSVGSDLPELAIAIDVAIKNLGEGDASNIVVGSAIGSTIGQINLVLGVAALLTHLTLTRRMIYRHGVIVLLGSIVLLAVFGWDGTVTRVEGVVLVAAYLVYFITLWTDAGKNGSDEERDGQSLAKAAFFLLLGFGIVIFSAEITVSSAIEVARLLEVKETVVAILLIGLGTSLPELSISVGAALKKKSHLSVGNLIGSNIFDTLVPIGAAAALSRVSFDDSILVHELPFLFILSATVLFFFARGSGVYRHEALVILGFYVAYVVAKVVGAF